MKQKLFNLFGKSMAIGIGFGLGLFGTVVIAVTVSATFNQGETLTANALNSIKTAVEGIPNLIKGTNANDAVYTDGNMGIGTTAPSARLEVQENTDTTNPIFELEQLNASGDASMRFITNGGNTFTMGIDDSNLDKFKISYSPTLGTTDRMTIDANGIINFSSSGGFIEGNNGEILIGQNGSWRGRLFYDYGPGDFVIESGNASTASGADLYFRTRGADRMIVNGSGNVGIGTTSPSALLHVNGAAMNTTGVWSVSSDKHLKKDISPLKNSLNIITKLQGVAFKWKDQKNDERIHIGFIAQEISKVLPQWVRKDKNGFNITEKEGLDALLVEAMKEQQNQIKKLNIENKYLKNQNDILIDQFKSIEKRISDMERT